METKALRAYIGVRVRASELSMLEQKFDRLAFVPQFIRNSGAKAVVNLASIMIAMPVFGK